MASITISGLTLSTTYEFHILLVGYSGRTGLSSNRITVHTKTLPGELTLNNYAVSPSTGSSTYQADILVPYVFVHLYIWDSIERDFDTNPGWPINFAIDDYVCTTTRSRTPRYTSTLARFLLDPQPRLRLGQRSVLSLASLQAHLHVDIAPGTLITDTSEFVVQVQGYNPYTTVFEPDPTHYDCKGSTLYTTPGLLAWCDDAVNNLGRNDSLSYATFNSSHTGNCLGDGTRSCGVFIQGSNCVVSGNDM